MPLATLRLESFRDGLEDYAYFRVLEETLRAVEADVALSAEHKDWVKRAKHALHVPGALGDLTSFIRDSRLLYRWRRGMAEAIESAPVAPAPL
jgi:hypothetical protein